MTHLRHISSRKRHSWVDHLSWFIVVTSVVAFAAVTTWLSQPANAKVIQVLFPFHLTIIGSWFLTMLGLCILRLLFRAKFTIRSAAVFCVLAAPIAASGNLEDVPGLEMISKAISPTFVHTLPLLALVLMLIVRPSSRSIDRVVIGTVGVVVASLHLLFHVALTIPEARLSRDRQADILELISRLPADELPGAALKHGGEVIPIEMALSEDLSADDLPGPWGVGATVVFHNLRDIINDAPQTAYSWTERGNTVFERIGYLYDGRHIASTTAPRIFVFPSTATNESLMNAQRAHFTLAAIGGAFWFLAALAIIALHDRMRARRSLQ